MIVIFLGILLLGSEQPCQDEYASITEMLYKRAANAGTYHYEIATTTKYRSPDTTVYQEIEYLALDTVKLVISGSDTILHFQDYVELRRKGKSPKKVKKNQPIAEEYLKDFMPIDTSRVETKILVTDCSETDTSMIFTIEGHYMGRHISDQKLHLTKQDTSLIYARTDQRIGKIEYIEYNYRYIR